MTDVKCYICKEKMDKDKAVQINISKIGKTYFRYIHEGECKLEYEKQEELRLAKKEEYDRWDALYQYIKKEIMSYKEEQKLSQYFVHRLQGLRSGKFVPHKNSKVFLSKEGYPYSVILNTFKIKKLDIIRAMSDKSKFRDNEQYMIDYIMAIISNNINDVYQRMKDKEESDKRVDDKQIDIEDYEFKNKNNINRNKVASKLSHLW